MTKRKIFTKEILYLLLILLGIYFYSFHDSFKTWSSEISLLFTSHSKEAIIGYLRSFQSSRPIVSVLLMVIQAVVIPFQYELMIFANIKVFGFFGGFCLSVLGRLLGAILCYDLGQSFLTPVLQRISKRYPKSASVLLVMRRSPWFQPVFRLLPFNFDGLSYVAGMMQLDVKLYRRYSLIWILLTTFLYAIKGGYFNYSTECWMVTFRLFLVILALMIGLWKHKRRKLNAFL